MTSATDPNDETIVGNEEWTRASYVSVNAALKVLKAKLDAWNKTALSHGASAAPYEYEASVLGRMIDWGDEQLAHKNAHEIVVRGISVESLRYIKAALIHAAWHFDAEIQAKSKDSWPPRVVEATRGRVRDVQKLAAEIRFRPAEVLEELRAEFGTAAPQDERVEWDVFVSHASEDKVPFVDELAATLRQLGLSVWYDTVSLQLGDSLRRSIDKGLSRSRYGVVVLSPSFFAKEWPQRELDGLVARESEGAKIVLPVWHLVDVADIRKYSPTLSDRLGISTSRGVRAVAEAIAQVAK